MLNEIDQKIFMNRLLDRPSLNVDHKWIWDMRDRITACRAQVNLWHYEELRKRRKATAAKKRAEAREAREKAKRDALPPRLDECPRCGSMPTLAHPALDGGAYVGCHSCHFAPQAETWAPDDRQAARKWNHLARSIKKDKEAR